MTVRAPFPDVEQALVTLLSGLAPAGVVTPPNLQAAMPFIRVARFGGTDDGFDDTASVSIDTFASTRAVSLVLAEDVRQLLLTPVNVVGDVVIDRVATITGPYEVPWATDQSVRRFTASYSIVVRR